MRIAKHFGYLFDAFKKCISSEVMMSIDILGARGSAKTKSVLITIAMILMINNTPEYKNKRIRINGSRLNVSSVNENFNELIDTLNELGIYNKVYINRKDRFIKYKDIEIRFLGYESSKNKDVKKLGIKRSANIDLMINIFEEIYEFNNYKDVNRIEQALGGAKSILTLNLSNPWNEAHGWLEKISENINSIGEKFDEEKMKDVGGNFFKINENKYIDWTNHRVNEYLSDVEHAKMKETWKFDPEQARIVDIGAMGVVEGGIYTRSIIKTNRHVPSSYKPFFYFIGVDVGTTRDATAFYLMSHNKDFSEFAIYDEYYHSHADQIFSVSGKKHHYIPKSVLQYADDIISLGSKGAQAVNQRLVAEIDYTSNLYQVVHEYSSIKHVNDLIDAKPCQKIPISTRIDMTNMLMNKKAFHINWNKCPHLIKEFKGARYAEKAEQNLANKKKAYDIIRLDGKDHGINAVENGIGTKFYKVRDLPYAALYQKQLGKK